MLGMQRASRQGTRGASLTEMALVTFVLLIILVGIVDFARAFYTYMVVLNASREGARVASRRSARANAVLVATKAEAAAGGVVLGNDDIEIIPPPDTDGDGDVDDDDTPAAPGDPITVRVSYEVYSILGHIIGFHSVPLQAQTEMIVFFQDPDS